MKREEVEVFKTNSGLWGAKIKYFDEMLQRENSVQLCSRFDPQKEADLWANKIYKEDTRIWVIYGLGMGYHIQALLYKLKKNQQLYVLETNKGIFNMIENYIPLMKMKDEKLKVIVTNNIKEMNSVIEYIGQKDTVFEVYRPSIKLIPSTLKPFREVIESYITRKANDFDKWKIRENYSVFEKENYKMVTEYYDKFKGRPILIISAGPSLDNSLQVLKEINKKPIVFATGRALKALIKQKIRVDLFCIIDADYEQTYAQIEGIEDLDIPLIFLNTASWQTINAYKGPKYIAYSEDSEKDQIGRIQTGGSVATAVLSLSILFGGSPIIFVGQDLAYSRMRTHADGIRGRDVKVLKNMKQVRGINEEYLYTTPSLLSFKNWIEFAIRRHPDIQFFNCTEEGAYIEGCHHQSLKEVLINLQCLK